MKKTIRRLTVRHKEVRILKVAAGGTQELPLDATRPEPPRGKQGVLRRLPGVLLLAAGAVAALQAQTYQWVGTEIGDNKATGAVNKPAGTVTYHGYEHGINLTATLEFSVPTALQGRTCAPGEVPSYSTLSSCIASAPVSMKLASAKWDQNPNDSQYGNPQGPVTGKISGRVDMGGCPSVDMPKAAYTLGATAAGPTAACSVSQIYADSISGGGNVSVELTDGKNWSHTAYVTISFKFNYDRTGAPPTPAATISSVSTGVASNSSRAPYADAASKTPLEITIKGQNFPTQGNLSIFLRPASLGRESVVQAPAELKSSTEISAKLKGFKDEPEGAKDLVLKDDKGNEIAVGKKLFDVTDLWTDLEVNQGVTESLVTKPLLAVAEHNTVMRAQLICTSVVCRERYFASTGRLHVFKDGKPIDNSPFAPDGVTNALPPGEEASRNDKLHLREALNFWFTEKKNIQFGEGTYDFYITMNPQIPSAAPAGADGSDVLNRAKNFVIERKNVEFRRNVREVRALILADSGSYSGSRAQDVGLMAETYFDFARTALPVSRSRFSAKFWPGSNTVSFAAVGVDEDDRIAQTWTRIDEWSIDMKKKHREAFTHVYLLTDSSFLTDPGVGTCGLKGNSWVCPKGRHGMMIRFRGDSEQTPRLTLAHELGHQFALGDTYDGSLWKTNTPNEECKYLGGCPSNPGNVNTLRGEGAVAYPATDDLASDYWRYTYRDVMGNMDWPYRWATATTWNHLHSLLAMGASSSETSKSRRASASADADLLFVSGLLYRDGRIQLSAVTHTPVPLSEEPDGGGSDYTLELQDGAGQSLSSAPLPVIWITKQNGQLPSVTSFAATVPYANGSARLVIKNQGAEAASRTISPNLPFVQLFSPNGGEDLKGTVTVSWAGSDPDSDALTYKLFLSTDNGDNWMPIASRLTGTTFEWNTDNWPGAEKARLMVVASDGVNEASASSADSFRVAPKGPSVVFLSPADGDQLNSGDVVSVRLASLDLQDGDLPDSGYVVTSNRDGVIGRGATFDVTRLSPGSHTLIVTATNSQGLKNTASIKISYAAATVPRIDAIQPNRAAPGAQVTITGANFGAAAADNTVAFGSTTAKVSSASATQLVVTVPAGLSQGGVKVTVTVAGVTSDAADFIVLGVQADVSPATLDFGSVAAGQTKDLSFTLRNTGSATLAVSTIGISNARYTAVSPALPFDVAAGSSRTVTIRFSPNAAGDQTGTLTLAGLTVNVRGTGTGTSGPATYTLARIELNRTVVDSSWTQGIAVLPGKQTLGPGERNFQMGWEFLWGDNNANRNRASAMVTLTTVPTTVAVGSTAAMAASMVGDWYTSGGYGNARDHTISLSGAAGTGQWSTVDDPNGTYHGSFTANGSPTAPAAGSNGEVALTTTARLNFGSDHWTQMDIRLVYTQGGTGGAANCTYSLAATGGSLGGSAASESLGVTATPSACQWAAVVSSGSWLTLSSGLNYAGQSTVRYAATANTGATRTGALTVAGQTYTITQTAGDIAPGISPTLLDFGAVPVNQSKDLSLTVRNNGSTPLTISSGAFSNPVYTFIPGAVPATVAAGQSGSIGVRFSPMAVGDQTGTLTIAGVSVNLKGTGVSGGGGPSLTGAWQLTANGCGFLAAWHATLNLTEAASGALSGTVQNDPLNSTILPDATGGWANASQLKSQHSGSSFGLVLHPDGWISVLQLAGTVSGSQISGKVTHYGSDDCPSFTMVPAGSGGSAALSASPASLDFGSVGAGGNKDLTLTLKNTGTAAASISSISSSNPRFTVPAGANSVPAGGSVPITVRFAPADSSPQNGTLTIAGNTPTITVPLSGTGVSGGGGGASINLQTVLQQMNLPPGVYTSPTVLASQGLTIVANPTGTPGAARTGQLQVYAVGPNEVHPPGTNTEAFLNGPGIGYGVLNCTTLKWTGTGSLTAFTITRPGVINGSSIPAWAMYAYDTLGNRLASTGEGNIDAGSFLVPMTYASFTVSSTMPIAQVVFCSHNGLSTYNALPLSGGKAAK